MESAPKIPEENKEKPKDSIGDKIKKWAKIGAVVGLGYMGGDKLEEKTRVSYLEDNLKENREHKIDSIIEVQKKEGHFQDYEEILHDTYTNIERTEKEIVELKNRSGFYKNVDDEYASKKLRKLKEDIEYLKKDVMAQALSMSPDSAKKEIERAYSKYDEQHRWLNEVVHNDEYKNRLKNEIGPEDIKKFGENASEDVLFTRKHLLNSKDYNVLHGEDVSFDAMAHFMPGEELVELPSNPPQGSESVGIHEFAHDITYGGEGMTKKAKDLYTNSFNIDGAKEYLGKYATGENIIYYMGPTELDARKKVLEYDLDKLGIKKYEEEFTEDHYKKALELMKDGKLSRNSEEFIKMTKPEFFLQIMNEIAENKVATQEDNKNFA